MGLQLIKRKRVYKLNFGALSPRQREVIGIDSWDIHPKDIVRSRAYSRIQAITQVAQLYGGTHRIDEMDKYADDFITEGREVLPKNSIIINRLAKYFVERDLGGYGRLSEDQQVEMANEFYKTHGIDLIAEQPPTKRELLVSLKQELAKRKRQQLTGMYRRIERETLEEQERQAEFERTGQLELFD